MAKKSSKKAAPTLQAQANDGTTCEDKDFYCEYYCSHGSWNFIAQAHSASYECVTDISGTCTDNQYTCLSPVPKEGAPPPASLAQNTADYAYIDGRLHVKRSWVDLDHFCPPALELEEIEAHDPVAHAILAELPADRRIVAVTINVKAWPKGGYEQAAQGSESTKRSGRASKKKPAKKKAAKKAPKKSADKKKAGKKISTKKSPKR